jgi:hypothetical protein
MLPVQVVLQLTHAPGCTRAAALLLPAGVCNAWCRWLAYRPHSGKRCSWYRNASLSFLVHDVDGTVQHQCWRAAAGGGVCRLLPSVREHKP